MKRSSTLPASQCMLSNTQVAERLERIADLLAGQHANPFRIQAYRMAAVTIRNLAEPVSDCLEREGLAGLTRLPGIGESLARSIEHLSQTGRLGLLDQLSGEANVEKTFATVSGIGSRLAARIHEALGIETLAELEAASYDGRLAQLPGMGPKKVRAVRESLAGRARRRLYSSDGSVRKQPIDQPPVSEILSVDEEYRLKAAKDQLPRIAPRRFNPTGEAWLPILHTDRGQRHYTALYSNTARAHEMGANRDWVVVYRDDHYGDGQWTVVTSLFGDLKGRRIVRGRENECG